MKKYFIILFVCVAIAIFLAGPAAAEKAFEADIRVLESDAFPPVNPLLLGNNLQWVDRGDEILKRGGLEFSPNMLEKIRELGPTVLRYPGGSLSDHYHWRDGIGQLNQRKKNKRFNDNRDDTVLFGTQEFLELCLEVGAEPLISINVVTGAVEEAVEWLKYTNSGKLRSKDGRPLPKVKYWEIGNEPYLIEDNRKHLALKPEEYARRANRFIRALKAADPSIRIGIPLRSDSLGGIPATPMQGFNDIVLSGLTQPFDFACLHNAYMPFVYQGRPGETELFEASMAASRVVRQDLDATRTLLKKYFPKSEIKLAITEYNALFTIGRGKTDGYIASLAGSIYLSDLIRVLSREKDVLMANYWSMTGNWFFGALDQKAKPRPSFALLAGLKKMFVGRYLGFDINCPTFDTKVTGFVPAQSGVPLVEALGARDQNKLSILLINKAPAAEARVTLSFEKTANPKLMSAEEMYAPSMFSTGPGSQAVSWKKRDIKSGKDPISITLKPHSITRLEVWSGGKP